METQGSLIRTAGVTAVCAVAAIVTIAGSTLPELMAARAAQAGPAPVAKAAPKVDLPKSRSCPDVEVGGTGACRQVDVRNTGRATVRITSAELAGASAADFKITAHCGGTLQQGLACPIGLAFQPTAAGRRAAVLVVRLSPGDLVHRVVVTGVATD